MKNCPKRSVSRARSFLSCRRFRFDRRPLMLRSAMMIQPNLARSSVMKMRRRRSSCSETRTCATNLASFWRCWTTASARLSLSDTGWTAANRKLSKKLERNLEGPESESDSCRISPWRNCVGRSPRGRSRSYGATQFNSSKPSLQIPPGRVLAWPKLLIRLKLPWICSYLQEKMCSTLTPAHLLSLHHPFAYDLIDRRLDETGSDLLRKIAGAFGQARRRCCRYQCRRRDRERNEGDES